MIRQTRYLTAHEYELLALKRMSAKTIAEWLDEQEKDEYYYRLEKEDDEE